MLIVFSGPSGVGKGTVLKKLMADEDLHLAYSVSMTTRSPRAGEKEGVNYFFVSEERFKEAIYNGELLEHAFFVDHYYGTPKAYVEKKRDEGYNVVLEIETVGAKQIMNAYKYDEDCISIFLTPPDMKELEARIRKRSSEPDDVIEKRVLKATQELRETYRYQYVICNDDVDEAVKKIKDILLSKMDKKWGNSLFIIYDIKKAAEAA